jgi:lipopolysaccharide transport system permease protein
MRSSRISYYADLLRELVSRDFKVRYKRSVVGFLWAFSNPLLYLCVFYFVFQVAIPVRMPRFGPFAFTGILAWTWLQSSILQAMGSITSNPGLIRTPGFAPAILPAVAVLTNFLHFLAGLALFLLFLLLSGTDFSATLLLLPGVIFLQATLTLGFGYLFASANVVFRDVGHLVTVFLQLAFFMTPIFYDANVVPEAWQPLYRLNPMVTVIESYRAALLGTAPPSWVALAAVCAFSLLLLGAGYRRFEKYSVRFAEEI